MATLDDKILGEKLQNYCSSSEDEGGSDDENSRSDDEECNSFATATSEPSAISEISSKSKSVVNTGPKGVLEDWRKFKQLEAENRAEMEKERIALAKKLTLSVTTQREDDEAKEIEELEDELGELMDEDFLMKYQQKRMQELMSQLQRIPKFGSMIALENKEAFINAIDKEDRQVTVIVHIYNLNVKACDAMDGCLNVLASDYPTVKFCRIAANMTGLSRRFRVDGVPALLVYKGGELIGNFVQLATELGNDFYATDLERFLVDYGVLPEN